MSLLISNRRYTGSKASLLNDIYKSIPLSYRKEGVVFADIFAGTGVVAKHMLEKGMKVIVNDFLKSNYVAYETWFGNQEYDIEKIKKIINHLNKIDGNKLKDNYFSKIYGDKYFSQIDAKKIGYIRDQIEKLKLNNREKSIILTSLMYAADKIANTVGHFEHYLSRKPTIKDVILKIPEIQKNKNNATLYNLDANNLVRKIECDIAYIDPPYNSRQYINFYHVLENLIRWDKPTEFEGKSMKFKRNELKSDYSKTKAPIVFKDLIENLDAKIIIVSYNNTYSARSTASNNKITEKQLIDILSLRGKVTKREIRHKFFNSGKTNFKDHREFIYVCEIKS